MNILPFTEFSFDVPTEVISSIITLRKYCEDNSLHMTTNQYLDRKKSISNIDIYIIQWVTESILKERNLTSLLKLSEIELNNKVEIHMLSTEWIIDLPEVKIIKDFIESKFVNPFGFRLHVLGPNRKLNDNTPHAWPRVFIPVTNSECEYSLIDNKGVRHSMFYSVGKCYMWDVRLPHFVRNHSMTDERLIATFMIDPKIQKQLF